MKAALVWLATLTVALLELLLVAGVAAFCGGAWAIFMIYTSATGGMR